MSRLLSKTKHGLPFQIAILNAAHPRNMAPQTRHFAASCVCITWVSPEVHQLGPSEGLVSLERYLRQSLLQSKNRPNRIATEPGLRTCVESHGLICNSPARTFVAECLGAIRRLVIGSLQGTLPMGGLK